ncbi:alpha,alpha-trehalase [Sphingomonas sp. PvP056]
MLSQNAYNINRMRRFVYTILLLLAGVSTSLAASARVAQPAESRAPPAATPSPADLFGELFVRVQTLRLFPDGKTFADAVPRRAPAAIMAAYRRERPLDAASLHRFVLREFALPESRATVTIPPLPVREHIAALWPQLMRPPLAPSPYASALALPHRYVVPGGRFREIYYWDSYFTMLGLVRDGHTADATAMVDNFADMVRRYGHVPNGSRSYYLSRSQPPFLYLMVGLLSEDKPTAYARYLDALRTEHRFWMQGAATLRPGSATAHVVRLADGAVLNRYWDARDTPREESYAEDVALAARTGRSPRAVYRDIRAAAESGWDFSSRWFADGRTFATIRTTALAPVDLNSLLFGLEQAIAQGCARRRDTACARDFDRQAKARAAAIATHLWDPAASAYEDLDWRTGRRTGQLTAATLMPLFVGTASRDQAKAVAKTVSTRLLRRGGIATTTVATPQQWDEPNGWAPLQWIAVTGLDRYDERALADTIAARWVGTVSGVFACTGRLVEKYDVDTGGAGGGGEYPVQDGFGWTNGVTRALLDRAPPVATRCASGADRARPRS